MKGKETKVFLTENPPQKNNTKTINPETIQGDNMNGSLEIKKKHKNNLILENPWESLYVQVHWIPSLLQFICFQWL